MAEASAIEWTDATWNLVRGFTKIGPGCKHCYAEKLADRFRGVKGPSSSAEMRFWWSMGYAWKSKYGNICEVRFVDSF